MEVGLQQDDFSDEKSVLADTKRKTAVPLFFASTDGLRLPLIRSHKAKATATFTSPLQKISLRWKVKGVTERRGCKNQSTKEIFGNIGLNLG